MLKTPLHILLVDDDETFRERLALSLRRRNNKVTTASHVEEALSKILTQQPDAAVIDLKMTGENGLVLLRKLKEINSSMRVIILTGYGSIATAMDAVRLGADDYLTKPVDADQIEQALLGLKQVPEITTPSLDRVEWEHLQRVLNDCQNNISQAARILGIDRRSLQRKLAKYPPA